jgi:ArsR family transcriptional regulator, lead/cadmium/zinc/bismuth-responsive transcriptional repressor
MSALPHDRPTPAEHPPHCSPAEHAAREAATRPDRAFAGAVALFKALGDEQRLRTLELLSRGEACGSEIAATFDEPLSTVSHRMKLLEQAGLVTRRREGRHVHFRLADDHVRHLVRDALDHAME